MSANKIERQGKKISFCFNLDATKHEKQILKEDKSWQIMGNFKENKTKNSELAKKKKEKRKVKKINTCLCHHIFLNVKHVSSLLISRLVDNIFKNSANL